MTRKSPDKVDDRLQPFLAFDLANVAHDIEQPVSPPMRQLPIALFEALAEILERLAQFARDLV